jgi:hypothetical protein
VFKCSAFEGSGKVEWISFCEIRLIDGEVSNVFECAVVIPFVDHRNALLAQSSV